MTSLAAFAPTTATAALKARPTARRTATAGTVAVRAGVPQKNRESRQPIINTRRALLGGAVSAAVSLALTPGRADAKDGKNGVYWIAPKDGATVPRSFTVKMGVKGFEVRAGAVFGGASQQKTQAPLGCVGPLKSHLVSGIYIFPSHPPHAFHALHAHTRLALSPLRA